MREIHGEAKRGNWSGLYVIWHSMNRRCHTPSSGPYKYYGEKGISVCEEWRESFEEFVSFAHSQRYEEGNGLTIDRINPFGNYEPGNCRFISRKEQNRNKKNTLLIEYQEEIRPLAEWAEILELNFSTLRGRYYSGKTAPEVLFRPIRQMKSARQKPTKQELIATESPSATQKPSKQPSKKKELTQTSLFNFMQEKTTSE